jgi:hypothetical protein
MVSIKIFSKFIKPLFELVAGDRVGDRDGEENNCSKNHQQVVHYISSAEFGLSAMLKVAGLQFALKELQAYLDEMGVGLFDHPITR